VPSVLSFLTFSQVQNHGESHAQCNSANQKVPKNRKADEEDGKAPNRESNTSKSSTDVDFVYSEAGMGGVVVHAVACASFCSNRLTNSPKLQM
jgi:ADP-ribosylglycohydrolase